MRRICWIGHPYFHASLAQYDWEVSFLGFQEFEIFDWQHIVTKIGFEPDIVVVADKSLPPFVLGIENFPCITIFYAVDSHIHSWFPFYAQAFDFCLVSLFDHLTFFKNKYLPTERIIWNPPFAKDTDYPNPNVIPNYDCLFVGSLNEITLPKRAEFMSELIKYIPLQIMQGAYVDLFPLGKTLINQCENDDLNFRIFEALGCGGCLVTPHIEHGFSTLFTNGEQLLSYESGNAKAAAHAINILLKDKQLRKKISENGFKLIDKKHRAKHRAYTFTQKFTNICTDTIIKQRLQDAKKIRKNWLRPIYLLFANVLENDVVRQAYLKAARDIDYNK